MPMTYDEVLYCLHYYFLTIFTMGNVTFGTLGRQCSASCSGRLRTGFHIFIWLYLSVYLKINGNNDRVMIVLQAGIANKRWNQTFKQALRKNKKTMTQSQHFIEENKFLHIMCKLFLLILIIRSFFNITSWFGKR